MKKTATATAAKLTAVGLAALLALFTMGVLAGCSAAGADDRNVTKATGSSSAQVGEISDDRDDDADDRDDDVDDRDDDWDDGDDDRDDGDDDGADDDRDD